MHSGMNNIRRQLTLFVEETEAKQIEAIRDKYNLQKSLSSVTLQFAGK